MVLVHLLMLQCIELLLSLQEGALSLNKRLTTVAIHCLLLRLLLLPGRYGHSTYYVHEVL